MTEPSLARVSTPASHASLLELRGITKAFPGVRALSDVTVELRAGEVLALIGENGAGKSTLMNILSGQYRPDSGAIVLDGQEVRFGRPADALAAGIAMIYQELNVIPDVSIADNIFCGRQVTSRHGGLVDRAATEAKAQELLDDFSLPFRASAKMHELSVAGAQMVEIIKAVSRHARIVVMDEPSSSLTEGEAAKLFATIRDLRDQGVAIVYISHRIEEIFDLADRVATLRDGQLIAIDKVGEVSRAELIRKMVGRELTSMFPKRDVPLGEVVLELEGLTRKGVFEDISFSVRAGEILGLSGLVGAGRTEIVRALFGLDPYDAGILRFNGRTVKFRSVREAIDAGIAMVSEDRKKYGLVLQRSIRENASLPYLDMFRRHFLLNGKVERERVETVAHDVNLKMSSIEQVVGSLSGGNQQKIVLMKWLMRIPKVMILDEPTRGIDVGAKSMIHSIMSDFAAQGMAIVMISSELPEILGMSDRILVIGGGRIKAEFTRDDATQEAVLAAALGGN